MTELYQPICAHCDERGDYTLATQVVYAPWGREDVCERCYDKAGEASAGREPDSGAVGMTEAMSRSYDAMEARRR